MRTTSSGVITPPPSNAVTLVPGEVLDGFTFGHGGYIYIPPSANLANQQFTWNAWVRPDGKGPNNDFVGSVIISQNIDNRHDSVALSWRATDNRFVFFFGSVVAPIEFIVSTDTFATGNFYLVAGTYDGAAFRLFVNGVLKGSFSEAKTAPYSSAPWTIGAADAYISNQGYPRTWNGVIDEVQAFNRALLQSEIQSIFNAASAGECKKPSVGAGGVVSASAFGEFTSVSPGSWIEIYGSNLAVDTRSWLASDFSGINAPTSLDGTSVTIGGQVAFIDFISAGQVNALVPSNVATGTQPMTVTVGGVTSAAYNITVNAVQPGLDAPPSFNIGGVQYVVALFADGTYVLPEGAIAGLNSRPAQPGDEIVLYGIYGIGFGPVTPDIPAGELVQQANTLASAFEMSHYCPGDEFLLPANRRITIKLGHLFRFPDLDLFWPIRAENSRWRLSQGSSTMRNECRPNYFLPST